MLYSLIPEDMLRRVNKKSLYQTRSSVEYTLLLVDTLDPSPLSAFSLFE